MNNKKKIKGFSKKYAHYVGFILAGALMGLSPQKVSAANEYNIAYEQECNTETDLEKYFNTDTKMNDQEQVTKDSEIYQILSFYEKGIKPENDKFQMELDPADNLVIANGLTVQFQEPIINYLSEKYDEDNDKILDSIKNKVKSGEKIEVPADIIEKCFINEIQQCRNNVIDSAKEFNINLGEAQINVLTELSYRYGKEQSKDFFKFISEGNNIEDYSVRILRTMSEEEWKKSNIKIYTEKISNEHGIVSYYAYEKPFGALSDFDGSIEELANINLEDEVEQTEMQFEGDKRRALFRQIGIMYNVDPIIINNEGTCRYTIDGTTYECPLYDYLSNDKQSQKIDKQSIYDKQNMEDSSQLEDTLITVVNEASQQIGKTEVENIKYIIRDDKTNEIKQEENGQANQKETALVPVKEKKKFNILKIFSIIGGAALTALGLKKAKDRIEKNKNENENLTNKRQEWINNIKVNTMENTDKVNEIKRRLKILFEVVNRRENDLPTVFEMSDEDKRKFNIGIKEEIKQYKNRTLLTKEEKEEYRKDRDYEIVLQNEKLIKKISKIRKLPRKFILEQLEKDIYNHKNRRKTQITIKEEMTETK